MSTQKIFKEYKTWPLALDEGGMRRLFDQLQTIVSEPHSLQPDVQFNIKYSDNSSVENCSLEEMLKDENISSRKIRAIRVEARGNGYDISIKFGHTKKVKDEDRQFSTVILEVSGPDRQKVFVTQSLIEDRLRSFKMGRPVVGLLLVSWFVFLLLLFLSITSFQTDVIRFVPHFFTIYSSQEHRVTLNALFLLFIIGGGAILGFTAALLFPDLEFRIGKGIDRSDRLQTLRANLLWVGVVGVGSGLVIGYLYH